ncbi:hypothetical protein SDC9_113081 [bioreactor metagenome]|uniref:Uncharacterized protein n=1 Tax=bioreactor metagenome TaxID=1076179 RepID=A0A645BWP1_9ZZZZ
MALLAVSQLHVEFFKARFCRNTTFLQIVQLRLDFGQIGADLLAARTGLLGHLREAQRFHLQLMRAALGLGGLTARRHQALRCIGIGGLGADQGGARLFADQRLCTQFLFKMLDFLRTRQHAGLLGILRIKAHAVRGHRVARGHINRFTCL